MRARVSTALLFGSLTAAAVLGGGRAEPAERLVLPTANAAEPIAALEVGRIQRHLAEVERELLARDVSHLTLAQRAARAGHIAALREYREAGRFPHNHHHPTERIPYFVDEHGTPCAMAYLIGRSGGGAVVDRVAAERNNALVPELADEPELFAWLDAAGLSLEEATRIQPFYDYYPPHEERREALSAEYVAASAITGALNGGAIALNLTARSTDRHRGRGVFGIVAGVAGVGLGLGKLQDGGSAATVGAVNAGIGLTSAVLGVSTLIAGPLDREPREVAQAPRGVAAEVLPLLETAGGGAGVQLRLAF